LEMNLQIWISSEMEALPRAKQLFAACADTFFSEEHVASRQPRELFAWVTGQLDDGTVEPRERDMGRLDS
jgi:hypothetical protein